VAADADRAVVAGTEDAAFNLMAETSGSTAMHPPPPMGRRRIRWTSVVTVLSAAVLIAAEVFGAAYAGGWALASLLDINRYVGEYGVVGLQSIFFALGIYVMVIFIRNAYRVEPFVVSE
jgi:hypothetical protein